MGYYKTEGIVLRRTNLGEADRIITFLTPEQGKLKAVAKGVRRIKSRMAGHLELFGRVNLMIAQGKSLDVITSARLIRPADGISGDFGRVSHAYLIAEMIDRLLDEGVGSPQLYHNVAAALESLEADGPSPLLELSFKLQLIAALGYQPQLDGCTHCHRHDAGVDYFFSLSGGGLMCAADATDRARPLAHNDIKLWRLLSQHRPEKLEGVAGATKSAAVTLPIINDFYDYTFGKRFVAGELIGG